MRMVVGATLLAAGLAGFVLLFFDGAYELIGYEILLFVAAGAALSRLRSPEPDDGGEVPRSRAMRPIRRPGSGGPPQLERIERLVEFGRTTAFDAEWRLLPFLRRIAAERLEARRGIEWDDDPEGAARLLGAAGWELLRSDRVLPTDRLGPGIQMPDLESAVSAIERLEEGAE